MTELRALRFLCQDCWLYGILSLPREPLSRGVLIVTGGPQYRSGSHRQQTLLAEALAARGTPVLRFDHRGMGDSEGAARGSGHIEDDLDCAVRHFFDAVPGMRELVLWGWRDGAAAAANYVQRDPRVAGLVLLNPVDATAGVPGEAPYARTARWLRDAVRRLDMTARAHQGDDMPPTDANHKPPDLYESLRRFRGRVLIVLSGEAQTAQAFAALRRHAAVWSKAAPLLRQVELPAADPVLAHTRWRAEVHQLTANWLLSW